MSDTKYARQDFLDGKITLYHGDNRDVLRQLPDSSIDSVVTDPPYALVSIVKRFGGANAKPPKDYGPGNGLAAYARAARGFMGKQWDTGEVAFSEEFWAEVLRVLKPGGHVAAFGASRGYHRMACAIEDAGFEIRDSLMWIYGTGFPKSHDVSKGIDKAAGVEFEASPASGVGFMGPDGPGGYNITKNRLTRIGEMSDAARQWEGWGTALKPAFEPIVLARKPLSEGTVAANVLRWGTGALNIDGCRIEAPGVDLGRNNNARKQEDGTSYVVQKTAMRIDNSGGLGRWPANVVHDGSDEVIAAFPNTAPAKAGNRGVTGRHDPGQGAEHNRMKEYSASVRGHFDNGGSAARFFYSAKASKADRAGSKHPTVKPISLMEWLATLITPPGGTVLDPFAGSGTTGAAARNKGFACILIEREAEYVEDIRRRLSAPAMPQVAAAVAAQQPANDNNTPCPDVARYDGGDCCGGACLSNMQADLFSGLAA